MEDLSDEMFAARHLRYEIYEKKQVQPLLNQRRRSRSNRSESEHSLTASASHDPRSPDTVCAMSSEAVGDSVFGFPIADEPQSDASVYCAPEQSALPTVDVRLCRISSSTLAAFTRTSSFVCNDGDVRTTPGGDNDASSWPEQSFSLVNNHQIQTSESSRDGVGCLTSSCVTAGLTQWTAVPDESYVTQQATALQ